MPQLQPASAAHAGSDAQVKLVHHVVEHVARKRVARVAGLRRDVKARGETRLSEQLATRRPGGDARRRSAASGVAPCGACEACSARAAGPAQQARRVALAGRRAMSSASMSMMLESGMPSRFTVRYMDSVFAMWR